jgi:hypothetical protein
MTPEPSYRLIPLTQGQWAIVDASDYDWLMQWKWYAKWDGSTNGYYAARNSKKVDGKQKTIRMHRQILGLEFGDKRQVDHVFHNTLDNRRFVGGKENLRIVNKFEQGYNMGKYKNNTTGYKGVSFHIHKKKYEANIRFNGKQVFLGDRDTAKEAYELYCLAASSMHGKYANLGNDDDRVRMKKQAQAARRAKKKAKESGLGKF